MRHTCFVLALVGSFTTVAQDTTATACPSFERSEVVPVDSATAQQLYQRAKRWFVDSFKDANHVIQLDDPANATVTGTGAFAFTPSINYNSGARTGPIAFTLSVECKDGRYRVRFYNVNHTNSWVGPIHDCPKCCPQYQAKTKSFDGHILRVCNEELFPVITTGYNRLLASLKAAMRVSAKTSDW